MVSAREQILHRLAMTGGGYSSPADDVKLLDAFARELATADKAEPYGISVEWPNARAYLLQLMASWGLKTRDGSREIADKILRMHAHELARPEAPPLAYRTTDGRTYHPDDITIVRAAKEVPVTFKSLERTP